MTKNMQYYFLDLPDNVFQPIKRYLDLVFTDDAQDNFLAGLIGPMTIPEWEKTIIKLGDTIGTPFIKEELL